MKKIRNKIIVILILLCMIFAGVFLLNENKNDVINDVNNKSDVIEAYEPVVTKNKLIMAGDSLIHDIVYIQNKTSDGKYDFTRCLEEIKPIVSKCDLAYYNQETILGGSEIGLSTYPQFNSPYEVGDAFVDAGFNIVSLANNHSLDNYYKKEGKTIKNSYEYWMNQYKENGVIFNGTAISQETRDNILIGKTENGLAYALLSYTQGTNGLKVNEGEEYLVNYIDKELIKNDVEKIRDKVDLLIVAMHWGREYTFEETDYQKEMAKYLASLNVDIVVGNHAHVIEPIERIDNTLVIYALGNIISAQLNVENLTGALCEVTITKTVDLDKTTINIGDIECRLVYTNRKDRFKLIPYSNLDDTILKNHESHLEFFKDILTKYDKDIKVS